MDKETAAKRAEVIISQHDGIHPMYEAFYIHSILYEAGRSIAAFDEFKAFVARGAQPNAIVGAIQEALVHASAVSRFFWPMKEDESVLAKTRGKRLRTAFQLEESSPLKWRKLRNAFEHLDEDLDRYLLNDLTGYFFPGALVQKYSIVEGVPCHAFRLVDPASGKCVILGKEYDYMPIFSEVARVFQIAQTMDSNGARLSSMLAR